MRKIECGEIGQNIDILRIKLNNCKTPTTQDLNEMLDIVSAIYDCSNNGGGYNELVTDKIVADSTAVLKVYPANSFHSFSLNVLHGSIEYAGVNFQAGSTRNVEYSTTNQKPITFKVNIKSEVLMEYLR